MRRPTEVWLAGTRWAIKWPEVLTDGDNGITTDCDRTIKVQAGADAAEPFLRQVLAHELMHAACFAVGGHWPAAEEDCVRMLERPILSLLEDSRNQKVVRYLGTVEE